MRVRAPNALRVSSHEPLEGRKRDRQACAASAGSRRLGRRERVRMVRECVERAPALPIPRMNSTGETPPWLPRGAVEPPAIAAVGITALIAAAAGFRSFVTYVTGEGGFSQRRWFGSFQTIH